jgi:hypothetical protein
MEKIIIDSDYADVFTNLDDECAGILIKAIFFYVVNGFAPDYLNHYSDVKESFDILIKKIEVE